jgi:hypothetical protein
MLRIKKMAKIRTNWRFLVQNKAIFFVKFGSYFKKNAIFSQKIVIITWIHGHHNISDHSTPQFTPQTEEPGTYKNGSLSDSAETVSEMRHVSEIKSSAVSSAKQVSHERSNIVLKIKFHGKPSCF